MARLYPSSNEVALFRDYEQERIGLVAMTATYYSLIRGANVDPLYDEGAPSAYANSVDMDCALEYQEMDNRDSSVQEEGMIVEDEGTMFIAHNEWAENFSSSISGEVIGTGDDVEVTFSSTLANVVAVQGTISVTDGVETFTDSENSGILVGDAGGTGSVDYISGDISVTFNDAPGAAVSVTVDYDYMTSSPKKGDVVLVHGYYFDIVGPDQGGYLVDHPTGYNSWRFNLRRRSKFVPERKL